MYYPDSQFIIFTSLKSFSRMNLNKMILVDLYDMFSFEDIFSENMQVTNVLI